MTAVFFDRKVTFIFGRVCIHLEHFDDSNPTLNTDMHIYIYIIKIKDRFKKNCKISIMKMMHGKSLQVPYEIQLMKYRVTELVLLQQRCQRKLRESSTQQLWKVFSSPLGEVIRTLPTHVLVMDD